MSGNGLARQIGKCFFGKSLTETLRNDSVLLDALFVDTKAGNGALRAIRHSCKQTVRLSFVTSEIDACPIKQARPATDLVAVFWRRKWPAGLEIIALWDVIFVAKGCDAAAFAPIPLVTSAIEPSPFGDSVFQAFPVVNNFLRLREQTWRDVNQQKCHLAN
jgi:hypothetical protein